MEGLEISILKLTELLDKNDRFRFDAEFVKKEYLTIEKSLMKKPFHFLNDVDCKILHPTEIKREFEETGEWFFRTQNLRPMKIEHSNNVFISKGDAKTLGKNKIKFGDVLITRTGANYGQTAIYNLQKQAIASSHVFILRNSFFDQFYIAVFFNTKYGNKMINKGMYGAAQPEISPYYLLNIPIPIFSFDFQILIKETYLKSTELITKAQAAYANAELLLLNILGLADFSPSTKNTTEKSFKNSFLATGRLDAEYYQPKFDELEAEIAKTHELAQLKDFLTLNQRGTQPNYAEHGLPVINSKHVREGEVLLTDNRFASLSEKEEPLFIKKGDVLINGTGVGTIGRAACYLHEQNALPDNHVTILRTDKINPVYLSVYLNSIAGKYQVDKYFKGSSGQIELYPKDIENFYIPLINEDTQTQIANLVQQSFTLKAESERLLEMAKRAVETAIETDERTAMAYINAQTGEQKP